MYFAVVITVLQSKSRDWPKAVSQEGTAVLAEDMKGSGTMTEL
jgi:hypothetical protein